MRLILASLCFVLLLPVAADAQVSDGKDYWRSAAGGVDRSRSRSSMRLATSQAAVTGRRVSVGARPAGCPRAWCGCWLALHKFGKNVRNLWLARNWLHVGQRISQPRPGAIAVYARGRRGGHVGVVTKVIGPGQIVLRSGNDGGAVRERARSTRGVIGYVVL